MKKAIIISKINKGVVFQGCLGKETFEEMEEKIREIPPEYVLEWLIGFLKNKDCYICNVLFDTKNSDTTNAILI